MKASPKITKVDVVSYRHTIKEVGRDYNTFNMVYEPGGSISRRGNILRIHADQGITGEYGGEVGGPALAEIKEIAGYLIGKDTLAREPIYNDLKRASRHWAMLGLGLIDICLWDIAGKFYDEPLYRLLGGEKRPLRAYASTLHGDENGGLTTPQDFEDFAQRCLEMGYRSFKVHGWGLARDNIER